MASLFLRHEDICVGMIGVYALVFTRWAWNGYFFENVLRIQEFWINMLWGEEITADDEDLRGNISVDMKSITEVSVFVNLQT